MPGSPCSAPSHLDRCAARAYLYTLFAQILGAEPSEALIEAATDSFARQAWEIAVPGHPSNFDRLQTQAPSLSATEFTRLFIGPGPAPLPSWESFYVAPSRSLFTRTTLDVRKLYRQGGYRAQNQGRIPDDHLSIELSFVAALSGNEAQMLAEGEDAEDLRALQRRFLGSHLAQWVPRFVQTAAQHAPNSCYAVAAEALAELTASHQEALG